MKRFTTFMLVLLVPMALSAVLLLWAYEPSLPVLGQRALDFYIDLHPEVTQIEAIVPVANPSRFTAEFGGLSFGDGSYFIIDHNMSVDGGDNVRPLPFPPAQLWCATLMVGENHPQIVLVALHEDLYKSAWVVHELAHHTPDEGIGNWLAHAGCGKSG